MQCIYTDRANGIMSLGYIPKPYCYIIIEAYVFSVFREAGVRQAAAQLPTPACPSGAGPTAAKLRVGFVEVSELSPRGPGRYRHSQYSASL